MTIQTRVRKDDLGHLVAYTYDDDPGPLTPEQLNALAKAVGVEVDEKLGEAFEAERVKKLEGLRESRLTREAYQELTPEERQQFDRENNPISLLMAVAKEAQQEADAKFMQSDQARQKEELATWLAERQKTLPAGFYDNGRAGLEKSIELADQGRQRAQARLQARAKRQLEAEAEPDDIRRVWASLDADEQQIFSHLAGQQPTRLEQIEQFKQRVRNPIADIESPSELYRLANNPPKRDEPYIPPTSEIASVESSRTLYQMHERDVAAKSKQKAR